MKSIGIYDTPVKPVLKTYRKAADLIEASKLDYTILRPTWFSNVNEVDYETTKKGEPEKGSVISQKKSGYNDFKNHRITREICRRESGCE